MNSPKISIVMPVWNAAKTLGPAIESLLNQTCPDFEFLVYDDGSSDGSLDIAQQYARADRRIRVVSAKHTGIVEALSQACSLARGLYLARMDADDVAHPSRLERQLSLMEANPQVGLCGAHVSMSGDEVGSGRLRYEAWINSLSTHEQVVRELFVECPIAHPTFFMRRDIYKHVGGYRDAGWAEDYDLCMRLWLHGARFAKVDEVLLNWCEHHDRHSMAHFRYSPEQFRALKRHFLAQSYLASLKSRRLFQWGAGEVGKFWLREWNEIVPECVVDINPRKIGKHIHQVPVIAPDDLPSPGQVFVIIAVGAPGARDEIRQFFAPRGYQECDDFVFVA